MSKLKELIELCKCSVNITINNHKDCYMSIDSYINEEIGDRRKPDDDIIKGIIDSDSIVELQAYADTPIGSYMIYHYDIDMAIEEMINIIKSSVRI